jgi:hypothetical protein
MVVSLKRVLIVLALVLASTLLAHGQGIEHRLISSSQPTTSMPTASASTLRSNLATTPSAGSIQDFRDQDSRDKDPSPNDHSLSASSLFHTTKTPLMSQSRLPVTQTRGGRLQVNFFMMSTNNKDILRGPLALSQSTQELAQPRFGDQYGISLGFPLGRDAGSGGSKGLWRGVSRVLHRR